MINYITYFCYEQYICTICVTTAQNYLTNCQPSFPIVSLETSITACSAYRILCVVPTNYFATKLPLKLTTTI